MPGLAARGLRMIREYVFCLHRDPARVNPIELAQIQLDELQWAETIYQLRWSENPLVSVEKSLRDFADLFQPLFYWRLKQGMTDVVGDKSAEHYQRRLIEVNVWLEWDEDEAHEDCGDDGHGEEDLMRFLADG